MADDVKPQVVNHKEATRYGFAATFQPDTFNEEKNTIDLIFYSGAKVKRRKWDGSTWFQQLATGPENVRLDRINTTGVMLDTHSSWDLSDVLGRVVPGSVKIEEREGFENKVLVGTVELSEEEADATAVNKIKKGIIPAVSVGFDIHKEEVTEASEDGPEHRLAVDWEPFEVSAVPMGADEGAQFLSADNPKPTREDKTMAKENKPKEPTIQPDDKADNALALVDAHKEGEQTGRMAGAAAEKLRLSEIQGTCDKLGLDEKFKQEWLDGEKTIEEFRIAAIDAKVDAQNKVKDEISTALSLEGGETEDQKRGGGMVDQMLHRGNPSCFEMTDAGRQYMGFTMLDITRECLERSGVTTRGMSKLEIAKRGLTMHSDNRQELEKFGFHTTSDFPLLLAAVTGKNLRQAYVESPKTFMPFTRQRVVPDFKTQRELLLSEAPDLDLVLEDGEFTAGTFNEGQETWLLATYGKLFTITRQAIINDDMNAFTRIPGLMGAAAARLESDIVWSLITDNAAMSDTVPLFHATHSNLVASGGAPSVAGISACKLLMRTQTGPGEDSAILNIIPRFLIVPAALETTSEQLINATFVPVTQATGVPPTIRALELIVEPRLDVDSATKWYMAADPSQIDTLVYGFLEGNTGPFVETREGFNVDGTEMKIRHDFGAGVPEYRGLCENNGS